MKLRRWFVTTMTAAAVMTGLAAPALAGQHAAVQHQVSISAGHLAQHAAPARRTTTKIQGWAGYYQGGNGNGLLTNGGQYNSFDAQLQGYVSSSQCVPFTCGDGANNTYNGRPVWVFYENGSGNGACISAYSDLAIITAGTSCGPGHFYSFFVSTANAPNGASGWHGLVNVGETNGAGGTGQYLSIENSSDLDKYLNYAGANWQTFRF